MNTLLETPGQQNTRAPASHQPRQPHRILVVEDDRDIRQLNYEALIRSGYQVDTAEDGDAAWKMLHAVRYDPDRYDLLITDNNMPKVSGVELVKKLRAAHMALPVIMASGAVPPDTEALQLAAILLKPFYPDQLVQRVKEVLHHASSDREWKMQTLP